MMVSKFLHINHIYCFQNPNLISRYSMAMTEEIWMREGWEIPGSDDEMEYDLTKCIDSKLTACFDTLS